MKQRILFDIEGIAEDDAIAGTRETTEEMTREEMDSVAAVEADMNSRYGEREHGHGQRPRRPRDFSHLHVVLEETVMTQFNMHRGNKDFGNESNEAVLKELKQLHDRCVLKPVFASSLSIEYQQCALAYLMFKKPKKGWED
jgi:hypothetical protein